MTQAGKESSMEMMYTLCKRIYHEKSCPADWGKAIIVLINEVIEEQYQFIRKKDNRDCNNYRGISLLSVPGKVYTSILRQRLKRYVEEIVAEEQAGFRAGIVIIIVISRFLKRYLKAKRTGAPAYSRELRQIKGGF